MTPEQAFDLYHRAIYSFAYRLTRRPDVAEDVTQKCFLAMMRAPQRYYAKRGSVKVYLFAHRSGREEHQDNSASDPKKDGEIPD